MIIFTYSELLKPKLLTAVNDLNFFNQYSYV